MTKRIKPHPLFAVWRADEVAECLTVSDEAYKHLWNVIVPMQPKPREDREELVSKGLCVVTEYPLRNYWSQVPHAMRRELNQAADKHEAEYRKVINNGRD